MGFTMLFSLYENALLNFGAKLHFLFGLGKYFGKNLSHLFNDSLDALDFLAAGLLKNLLQLLMFDSRIGVAVLDIDAANLVNFQTSSLTQESHNVTLRNLVLFALANVNGSHARMPHLHFLTERRGE
jgi:hypothetical protein